MVHFGSNGVDVFPSLHIAVPAFILAFDFLHHRKRFWLCLVPVLFLWLSTVYLRYHYFVDVLAGFLLAVLALGLACKWPVGGVDHGSVVEKEPKSPGAQEPRKD
jgi:membrane-associated phospholipid phosphatase